MATSDLESSINSIPDSAILPCFQEHSVVQAKLLDFSAFKPLGAKHVFDQLSTFITSSDMLVIAPSDTLQPVPLHQMTLEALCQAMRTKLRAESQPLLGDEHVNVFEDLKAMVEVGDDDSVQALIELQQLCFRSILESISCASVKKGALYSCPFTQKPVLLLGSRGLFITDKARVAAALQRQRKAENSKSKPVSRIEAKKDATFSVNPQGKPRRTISDEGEESNASIEDVSCHEGDGESPYDSEWAFSQHSSTQGTPVMAPQQQGEVPIQLSLTPVNATSIAPTNLNAVDDAPRPPLSIQLAHNPVIPLVPASISGGTSASIGMLGPLNPLGGTLGSVPLTANALKKSSRRKSKKHAKAKSSKKSRKSKSRSRSTSSISSIEVPPPKPSADQVFCCVFTSLLV